MPVVTGLRAEGRRRVAVELGHAPWRVLPAEAVLRAGLAVGVELDRARARLLRRELVRLGALTTATRALRARDLSSRALDERLGRAGIAPLARRHALATLAQAGLVDDGRTAARRAEALAGRGYGDAAIESDLERRGLGPCERADALAALEPEPTRARRIVDRRGASTRTARYLAARGFGREAMDAALPGAGFANDP